MDPLSVKVVIDYQNIHLTGHELFVPEGIPKHQSLVHPLFFATQWVNVRSHVAAMEAMRNQQPAPAPLRLDSVVVYRGLPSNKINPNAYRRNQAQKSEWTRDRRVQVNYRPLRYHWVDGYNEAQEKGIDVLVALDLVRSADRGDHDVLVLASHDTDMEPALAAALEGGRSAIETVGWANCRVLKVPGTKLWHTTLHGNHFVNCRDRKDYS